MNIDCDVCGIKFSEEMIVSKKFSDFNQCYDCLYFMNFNDNNILNGSMGYDLKKYIEISSKYHSTIPCNNLKNNSGCYVCMYVLDIPFELPKNEKIELPKNEKIELPKTEDYNSIKTEDFDFIEIEDFDFNIVDNNYVIEQDIIINL